MHSRIAGTGGYLPAKVLTNAELATRIDTSDEWVRTRTGICERRIAADGEQTSDLALAARALLAAAGIDPADVDLIVVARPPRHDLSVHGVCILQAKLRAQRPGLRRAGRLQRICLRAQRRRRDGESGAVRNALVVGAEIYSRILDWNDRGTCVLFGDGAGAVVLCPTRPLDPFRASPCRRPLPRHPVRAGDRRQRRRQRAAVPAHGWDAGVQVRGEGTGRSCSRGTGREQVAGERDRLADSAPG